jgi:hypothetical protein
MIQNIGYLFLAIACPGSYEPIDVGSTYGVIDLAI